MPEYIRKFHQKLEQCPCICMYAVSCIKLYKTGRKNFHTRLRRRLSQDVLLEWKCMQKGTYHRFNIRRDAETYTTVFYTLCNYWADVKEIKKWLLFTDITLSLKINNLLLLAIKNASWNCHKIYLSSVQLTDILCTLWFPDPVRQPAGAGTRAPSLPPHLSS